MHAGKHTVTGSPRYEAPSQTLPCRHHHHSTFHHLDVFQFPLIDTGLEATSRHTAIALRLYHYSLLLTATTIS
jgi:hypothetical protein